MTPAELLKIAHETCRPMELRENFRSGDVGAALLSASGKVYTGVCIDLACGLGFCAETAAAAEMLKAGETRIVMVAAAFADGSTGAPCGRCRETMVQIDKANYDTLVVMGPDKTARLGDLLPGHWLSKQ